MGNNDTSSRPPKDLGGTLRRTLRTALWSYDSLAKGDLQYPLSPGMRGKYGEYETNNIDNGITAPEQHQFVFDLSHFRRGYFLK